MALVKKTNFNSRLIIILVVVVVVSGVGYLIYNKMVLDNQNTTINSGLIRHQPVPKDFDNKILSDPRYQNLRSFDSSVTANANDNPGQPYPFQ